MSAPAHIDVLILTALQDELAAVLALEEGGRDGWQELRDRQGFRYYRRTFLNTRGDALEVGALWTGEMGARTAAIRGQQLVAELDPACLAMCGICAGYRKKVALGDVIVADQLYTYDEGKAVAKAGKTAEVLHNLRTFDLEATWKMDAAFLARELDLSSLARARPPSKEAQRHWLLNAVLAYQDEGGPAPAARPDRKRACPRWTEQLREALAEGLIVAPAGRLALTDKGRERVLFEQTLYPDGVAAEPVRVHLGAVATGVAVQEDPGLFERLRKLVRTTLGVEMEGAAIGDLAARFEKRAILVKAVSDHADHDKDDSFREFACRASAEVLMAFLRRHLEPEGPRRSNHVSSEPPHETDPVQSFRSELVALRAELRSEFINRTEPLLERLTLLIPSAETATVMQDRQKITDELLDLALHPTRARAISEVEALRNENDRLRALHGLVAAILNQSPLGIIVADAKGKLTFRNRAAERIWAGTASANAIVDWGKYRAFHADGQPYQPEDWSMARCLTHRETVTAEEIRFQRFDGTRGMMLGSCAPILGEDGDVIGAVSVFADITVLKQAKEG